MRHLISIYGVSTLTLFVLLQQAELIVSFMSYNIRYGCICDELRSNSIYCLIKNDDKKKKTVTFMGFKSFINKRVREIGNRKKKEDNEDSDNENESDKADEDNVEMNEETQIENMDDLNLNNETKDKSTSIENNVMASIDNSETIFERIERMKSGGLTNEEKENFLNTALTRTSSVVGNKRTGLPIRQTIPMNLQNNPSISPTDESSPSPFPKDSLWNSVIGAGTEKTQEILKKSLNVEDTKINIYSDSDQMDESQKRAWFEMITSPTRFASFSGSQSQASKVVRRTVSQDDAQDDAQDDTQDDAQDDTQDNTDIKVSDEQQQPYTFELNSEKKVDLASRLEKAAIMQEKKAADARLKREEERIVAEKREMEQRKKFEILKKQQEQELIKQEQEMLARKKQQELRKKKVEEERMNVEKERMKQLEKAQEEYWKKKIEHERKSKLGPIKEASTIAKTLDKSDEILEDIDKKQDECIEKEKIESPKNEETKDDVVIINKTSPKKDNNFMDELDKAKNKLDAMLDQQLMQLSQLNSPLPSPVKPKQDGVKPKTAQILKSSPPTQVSFPSTPPSLVPINKNQVAKSQQQPSTPKSPFNGWGSLGRKETVELKPSVSSPSTSTSNSPSVSSPSINSKQNINNTVNASSSTPRLSLKEMTKYKGKDLKSTSQSNVAVSSQQSKSTITPNRKGPIRQQILFDDDDDDESDVESTSEYQTIPKNSKKSNLEIPKDQQEKANKWGINLDLLK